MVKLTKEQINQLKKYKLDPKYISDILEKIKNNKISNKTQVVPKNNIKIPSSKIFTNYNDSNKSLIKIGISAIEKGHIRYDIANGGAATRYYDISSSTPSEIKRFKEIKSIKPRDINMPKCLCKVIDSLNYLDLKLFFHLKKIYHKYGVNIPVHIMNNFLTNDLIKNYIANAVKKYHFNPPITYTVQTPLPRFTFNDNLKDIELYSDGFGNLNLVPPGHGDYLNLVKTTLINNKKIKYIIYSNVDNLGAAIDPSILGFHIQSGADMTIEICEKSKHDEGGIPLIVNNKLQIVEQFKLSPNFNQTKVPYFNSATYIFTVSSLKKLKQELPWYLVQKNAYKYPGKSLETEKTYQLEHLIGDLSMYLKSNFLIVPREKRFWPAKRYCDLLHYLYPNKNSKFEMKQHQNFMKLLTEEYGVIEITST